MNSSISENISSLLQRTPHFTVSELTDRYLQCAFESHVSDIHIDPFADDLCVRFRIDGILHEIVRIPKTIHGECIARLKILSGLRTDERFKPQDGRFRFTLHSGTVADVRVSIAPTYYGENAVLRLLSSRVEKISLSGLGFSARHEQLLSESLSRNDGMILLTGPTGSGKTTSLYALIQQLSTQPLSVATIEDPIEYSLTGVSQMQVNTATGFTFANGLRSILRQDPDVLMVGEIRDSETTNLAVNAALTGHLILSTLHTNDAPSALPRLMDMGAESYLLASTVRLVIAQRLVRRICNNCKVPVFHALRELVRLQNLFTAPLPETLFVGSGCAACNGTGYRGRIGIYEFMFMSPDLEERILARASSRDLRTCAQAVGMLSLEQDGLAKAAQGLTSIDELIRIHHD